MAYIRDGSLGRPRRHFFSETIHRWSFLAQNPTLTTYREAVGLTYFLYCVYQTFLTLATLRNLLWHQRVEDVCYEATSGMACLSTYMGLMAGELLALLGKGVQWGVIVIVVVFLGEEVIMRMKGKA